MEDIKLNEIPLNQDPLEQRNKNEYMRNDLVLGYMCYINVFFLTSTKPFFFNFELQIPAHV